jgi:hypothetical protein
MDIAACVEHLYPDPVFTGSATIRDRADWESREWIDERGKKPTWAQLEAIWPTVEPLLQPPLPGPTIEELAARIAALEAARTP